MSKHAETYGTQSPWSEPARWTALLGTIPPKPDVVVKAVSGLVLHILLARARNIELPSTALDDLDVRHAEKMLDRIFARDSRGLECTRSSASRFYGVCSHYALLATSIFRTHGVPARVRAGFAAYLTPGRLEDHWVCEYQVDQNWRLLDANLDEGAVSAFAIEFTPWEVPRDQFLDASAVWCQLRTGEIDPAKVGLSAVGLAGTWYAAASVLRDVAALNKEETCPWDYWSVARDWLASREVSADSARRLDEIARLLQGAPTGDTACQVYRDSESLRLTPTVLTFRRGKSTEVAVYPADR
jgi:hypothetical protein